MVIRRRCRLRRGAWPLDALIARRTQRGHRGLDIALRGGDLIELLQHALVGCPVTGVMPANIVELVDRVFKPVGFLPDNPDRARQHQPDPGDRRWQQSA